MRAWLAQATVRALFGRGAATLAFWRSSITKERTVCRTPIHLSEVIVTHQNQDTRRCRSRRSHGEDAITGPSRSSPDTPHNNNLLGSQSVPLLLIDNNQESTVVQDRQPAGRRQPLQCAIGWLRSTRPAGPRRPKRRRGLGTAGDAVSYAPCKEPTPPYKHRAGSVWRRQLRCSSSPSEKHGWRVLGGIMGPVQ